MTGLEIGLSVALVVVVGYIKRLHWHIKKAREQRNNMVAEASKVFEAKDELATANEDLVRENGTLAAANNGLQLVVDALKS